MTSMRTLTALSHAMADLNTISRKDLHTNRFLLWHQFTTETLIALLGEDSPALAEFESICFAPAVTCTPEEADAVWRSGKNYALGLLTTVRFQPYLQKNSSKQLSFTKNEVA